MHQWCAVVFAGALALAMGSLDVAAQSGGAQAAQGQTEKKQQATTAQQVTLTGCVRQTSDDPKMFALVRSTDAQKDKATGTAGSMGRFPIYRLQESGENLKNHVGHRVEIAGKVTPAKDEKGADIVSMRTENLGVPTTTITTVDLKPAPLLAITSVKQVAGECPEPAKKK